MYKSLTKERTMKRMVFFITLTFLLSVSIMLLPVQVFAQKSITIVNQGFEKPDSGKIEGFEGKTTHTGTGFKVLVVPGWHVDAPDSSVFDSGVEPDTHMSGKYHAYLMGYDPGIYQIINRRCFSEDMITLTVDAKYSWAPSSIAKVMLEMFYLDGDSATAPRVVLATDTQKVPTTGVSAPYSVSYLGSQNPLATGHKLGILFKCVSPDSNSWINIDNVRLTNGDPTIIGITNYSFEIPDSGKIKGWNGPGSENDSTWTGNKTDIPGWSSDTSVYDSGIEAKGSGNPQEGQYSGYLMGSDTSVWNTTNYTILAGDVIKLRVMGNNSWQASILHAELYYVDSTKPNNRVTLAFSDNTLNTDYSSAEYSVSFAADTISACIGKKLGVLLDNVSPIGQSWLDIDFVRLNANHAVDTTTAPITSVSTKMSPSRFSLAQNYPNPFNPSTKISYTLTNSGKVRLAVYDLLGREVSVLANEIQTAGQHVVTFSANRLSSGIYFYKLQTAGGVITKKMMLLK
jgi:hypothetical protein